LLRSLAQTRAEIYDDRTGRSQCRDPEEENVEQRNFGGREVASIYATATSKKYGAKYRMDLNTANEPHAGVSLALSLSLSWKNPPQLMQRPQTRHRDTRAVRLTVYMKSAGGIAGVS